MKHRSYKLAHLLINHSLDIKTGDKVVISASDFSSKELIIQCYKMCLKKGAQVYLDIFGTNFEIGRSDYGDFFEVFMDHAPLSNLKTPPEITKQIIKWGDKFIRITSLHNRNFLSNADPKRLSLWNKTCHPIIEGLIKKPWVLTYFPTIGTAQNASMSLSQFTKYYYEACILDYKQLDQTILPLQTILDKGKNVHIKTGNTDLNFSIDGRLAEGSDSGKRNIPDGECFIAPIESSTTGYIKFDDPQNWNGVEISNIYLEFQNGRIVKFDAIKNKRVLSAIFKEHPDNMRIGEFGIGMNPNIKQICKDILFDEKVKGTIHLALGKSYSLIRGGGKNKGTIHWDMIKDLRKNKSQVKVDNKTIIKDGKVLA